MQLVVNSSVYNPRISNIYLNVAPYPDYSSKLAGTYPGSYDLCAPADTINYYSTTVAATDTNYKITISNVKNMGPGFVIRALLSTIITIPVQTVDGYTIWGSGTYAPDGRPAYSGDYIMTINDTMVNGLDSQICVMHIQH
jgi:hypothetical protein